MTGYDETMTGAAAVAAEQALLFGPLISTEFHSVQQALEKHGGVEGKNVLLISGGLYTQGPEASNYALALEDKGAQSVRVLLTQASDDLKNSQQATGLNRGQPKIDAEDIGEHGGVSFQFEAQRATQAGANSIWNALDTSERNSANVIVINDLPYGSFDDAHHTRKSFLNRVLRVAEPGTTVVMRAGCYAQDFTAKNCQDTSYFRVKEAADGMSVHESKSLEVVDDRDGGVFTGGHILVARVKGQETPLPENG